MIILSIAVTIFIVIIGMLIYSNWKSSDAKNVAQGQGCGCGRKCPCSKCGAPPNTCGCPYKPKCQGGCSFC
jgi:hypothetical protein